MHPVGIFRVQTRSFGLVNADNHSLNSSRLYVVLFLGWSLSGSGLEQRVEPVDEFLGDSPRVIHKLTRNVKHNNIMMENDHWK